MVSLGRGKNIYFLRELNYFFSLGCFIDVKLYIICI